MMTKSITFDVEAQEKLPQHIKDKMAANMEKSRAAKRLLDLTGRHKTIMDTKDILVSVYTNASGFLWRMMKVSSGTDLGWCGSKGIHGRCINSGAFLSYEDAFENALDLIDKCDLEQYMAANPDGFHWCNYAEHLNLTYGSDVNKTV